MLSLIMDSKLAGFEVHKGQSTLIQCHVSMFLEACAVMIYTLISIFLEEGFAASHGSIDDCLRPHEI